MGLRKTVTAPARRLGAIGFVIRNLRLTWGLIRDRRVGLLTKLSIPGVLLLYVISPAVLLNAIPVVGEIDDVAIAAIAISLFLRLVPRPLVQEHQARLEGGPAPVDAEYRLIR